MTTPIDLSCSVRGAQHRLRGHVIVWGMQAALVGSVALGTSGIFGQVNPSRSLAQTPEFVLMVVWHVVLAMALTATQWLMGAGIARALLPKATATYAEIALLGFVVSLPISAALVGVALVVPYGIGLAAALAVMTLFPLLRWPIPRSERRSLGASLIWLFSTGLCFGCWTALNWHGPTELLKSKAYIDHTFYASTILGLSAHPVGWPNLTVEGEAQSYFNLLIPAMGAALFRVLPLDGFLFVSSSAAIAALGTGLALHAYQTARPLPTGPFGIIALILALFASVRLPALLVTSPPLAHTIPLAIAVWFWSTRGRQHRHTIVVALSCALVGTVFSKVTTLIPLGPVACIELRWKNFPPKLRITISAVIALAGAYAAYMMVAWFDFLFTIGGLRPESLTFPLSWPLSLWTWAVLARDCGTLVLVLALFRALSRRLALVLCGTLILSFLLPVFVHASFTAAVVLTGVVAAERRLSVQDKLLICSALILLSPPLFIVGPTVDGFAWLAAVTGSVIFAYPVHAGDCVLARSFRVLFGPTLVVVTVLILIAAGRGTFVPGFLPDEAAELTPAVRDIWRAVRERTPQGALIFTDQTGPEPSSLLQGANTYAQHGQRQVFFTGWLYSLKFRNDLGLTADRLRENEEILSARRLPTEVHGHRSYTAYFLVVSTGRPQLQSWELVYKNPAYALYRWHQPGSRARGASSTFSTGKSLPV